MGAAGRVLVVKVDVAVLVGTVAGLNVVEVLVDIPDLEVEVTGCSVTAFTRRAVSR